MSCHVCKAPQPAKPRSSLPVSDPELCYVGTEPWKPKEALQDDGVITDKADIFAFGLTLWEMMTLSVPHLNLDDDLDDEGLSLHLASEQLLLEMLSSLRRVDFCSVLVTPKGWVSLGCHPKGLQICL